METYTVTTELLTDIVDVLGVGEGNGRSYDEIYDQISEGEERLVFWGLEEAVKQSLVIKKNGKFYLSNS